MTNPEFTTEELATEEWRDIADYEGFYQASNLGRIRRLYIATRSYTPKLRILKPKVRRDGYLDVTLSLKQVHRSRMVHILVARAFLGECPAGKETNHIDRVRANARANNLEYLTRLQNAHHSACNLKRGEACSWATLTDDLVREIRIATGSQRAIARRFNSTQQVVQRVRARRTWKHVD